MTPRLTRLSVSNFRSIRGRIDVELDAPIVLIHGANGSGKTSLLSAFELALTGSVKSLQSSGGEDNQNLIHFGAESAEVAIECRHPSLTAKSTKFRVFDDQIVGAPLLTGRQTQFYTERCFLAQAMLGRLLEIYEDGDAQRSDSPLTRFVQELLGLDQLDNIINGLHHLEHLKRLKSHVPAVGEVDAERKGLAKRVDLLTHDHLETKKALQAAQIAFDEAVVPIALQTDRPLQDVMRDLEAGDDRVDEVKQLSIVKREVIAAQSLWLNLASGDFEQDQRTAANELRLCTVRYHAWSIEHEERVMKTLALAEVLVANLPPPDAVGFHGAHEAASETVYSELLRRRAIEARDEKDRSALAKTHKDFEKSADRHRRLEERLSDLAEDSGRLASILSEIAPLIEADVCPVCHRNFGESSDVPLRAHLTTHIAALSRTANELQEANIERQSIARSMVADRRLIDELQSNILEDGTLAALTSEIARLEETTQKLKATASLAEQGDALKGTQKIADQRLSQVRQNQVALSGLRTSTAEFPRQLGIAPPPPSEMIDDTLARCLSFIVKSLSELDDRRAARTAALEAGQTLVKRSNDERRAKDALIPAVANKKRVDEAWSTYDNTRIAGRALTTHAVSVRTNIVSQVFNNSLNEIWKDLFIRLAPDEQFIPAFALPESNGGPVVARLETLYRGENRAGNPRAMLSAGNLNTAALTLFLSLHLSVDPVLPWLIIDDPVQSMDEIHISQFAALLRTLSRQHERQIIVAVHEKPLFDYLALELGPASEGERLATIELSRAQGQDTTCRYAMKVWEPSSVFRAGAQG